MFQVPSPAVLLGLTLCMIPLHKAIAEQFNENDLVYEASRNKIGLIHYCSNNGLLEPANAEQAITAVVRNLTSSDIIPTEQGDRAQKAGEEGFWEAGRTRDIASIAKLFRTTPADLCQEWADETLRAAPDRRREVTTTTVVVPKQDDPQIKAAPVANSPATAPAATRAAAFTPGPPLPERAPLLPAKEELTSLQRTVPTSARLTTSNSGAVSGRMSGGTPTTTSATPQSSGQPVSLSSRPATEAEGPPPGEQTVTATEPLRGPSDQSRHVWQERPFNRLGGKPDRCFMPGCKWPARQERQSWGY